MNFEFFFHGPLSQWEESFFTVDEVEYNCAEQYMMAEKARLFQDEETLELIMGAERPKEQKALGRTVKDFDKDVWQEDELNGRPRCWNIVWRGNMAKFSQNEWLFNLLINTKDKLLVEASPFDRIWGVGLRKKNPLINKRENWQGNNWLGEVLTVTREMLKVDNTQYLSRNDPRIP